MLPTHIAISMDGNRRWARQHNVPILEGHRKVADEVLERLVEHAVKRGIPYMTVWAFSTENWNRSSYEVNGLMLILKQSLGPFGKRMMKKGVKLRVIGDLSRLNTGLQKSIEGVVRQTQDNTRITVTIALNYGGRDEIIRAIRKVRDRKDITQEKFAQLLDTDGIPDPDLIIRPGGDQRLSGFLLWQSQYSELYFPAFLMPDFTPARLDAAIQEFGRRKRRFGK